LSKKAPKKKTRTTRTGRTPQTGGISRFIKGHLLWLLLGLIVVGGVCSILVFSPLLSTNGDNALYIVLALSWAQGKGNSTICTPGEPPNTMVPPGYPLLLAPLTAISTTSYVPLKLLSTVLFLLSLPLLMLIIVRHEGRSSLALAVAVLAAVNYNLLAYGTMVMTEIPFLFFSLLGIFLLGRSLGLSGDRMSGGGKALFGLAIFCLVFAYHIRSIGVVLPAALVIMLLLKKRYRLALVAFLVILCLVLPWAVRNSGGGEGGGYLEQFLLKNAYNPALGKMTAGDAVDRVVSNIRTYGVFVIPAALFPSMSPLLSFQGHSGLLMILGVLATLITLLGFVIRIRRSIGFLEIYTFLFLGVCLVWPQMWSGMRFVVPIIPLLIYYFLLGLSVLAGGLSRGISPLAGKILWAVILIILSYSIFSGLAQASARFHRYPAQWENYFRAAEWCGQNTPPESICLARKPSLFYLRARRQVLNYPYTADTSEMMTFLSEKKIDYVVVDGFTWTGTTARYLIPAVQEHQDRFEALHHLDQPHTWVLRVLKMPPGEEEHR